MIPDRRAYQRFDITTVLEFKLQSEQGGTFVGITKNFSYEGFCLETQCVAFEPGDTLEVRLKHPHTDLTVSVPATVVWKRNAEKFAYLMGIKLGETELDTRVKMLEIMSAAGEVPVDSFILGSSEDNRIEIEETAAQTLDLNVLHPEKAVPEEHGTCDEDIEPEHHRDEGLLSAEGELITGNKSESLFKETFDTAVSAEGPEAEDMFNEEGTVSDMPWPKADTRKEETDQIYDQSAPLLKKVLRNRKVIYSSVAAVLIAVSVYALSLIFKSPGEGIKSPAPVPAQSAFHQEEERNLPVPPVETPSGEVTAPGLQQPDALQVPKEITTQETEQQTPPASQKPPDIKKTEDQPAFPQEGERNLPAPPFETPSGEVTAPGLQQPDALQVPKEITTQETEQQTPPVSQKPPDIKKPEDQPPYIQVGAWKNPDNAREMLQKIKKYYPDAYLVAGKKFTRVKIPIESESQGKEILKEIEDRFQIKALLTLKR
jgi:cell division septation protein DedD